MDTPLVTLIRLRLVPSGLKCEGEGCGDANAVAAYRDEDGEVFGLCEDHNYFTNAVIIDEFVPDDDRYASWDGDPGLW